MLGDLVEAFSQLNPAGIIGVLLLGIFIPLSYFTSSQPKLPLINGKKPLEFRATHARKRFLADARNLISTGLSKAPIFRILTENGYKLVLSSKYADEIRSHESLSFGRSVAKEFHTHIPGFEPFKQGTTDDHIFQDAVRMKLTQSLGNLTEPLSTEVIDALQKNWTDNPEWHTLSVRHTILKIVAQLSSKVFLGDQICRDPDWLRITINYTVDAFLTAEKLRMWPWVLRPIVALFLPESINLRAELREAREIIKPVIEKRRMEKAAAREQGKEPKRYADAIEWMEQCAKGKSYDPAIAQLSFSLAAIHTTSDMISQVLYDICGREELIQELREEVISVIREEGWKKSTLYKLKLMDSMLKESQRLKPISVVSMRREAMADVQLSDGTQIPKGGILSVSSDRMWDPAVYPNPETFDPYRFLKLRETPGRETSSQLVSPSPEHLAFGLGKHACPGRFFAANEVKILLCHLLLKYEIKSTGQSAPQPRRAGVSLNANRDAQITVRRRKEEVEL